MHSETPLSQLIGGYGLRLERLEQVLRDEQQCIADRQPEQLTALLQDKTRLLRETEEMDRQRLELLAGMGLTNDSAGMQALIGSQQGALALQAAWDVVLDKLSRCRALNEANGAIIRRSMNENQRLLDLLRGEDPNETPCYGIDGGTTSGGSRDLGKA